MGTQLLRLGVVLALVLAGCGPTAAAPTSRPAPSAILSAPTPSHASTPVSRPTSAPSNATPEFGSAPVGPTETATVISITDGDTIRVDRGHGSERLRYIGMDTPETGRPGGAEATAANAALVAGKQVVLERDVSETDQYGRLLRYVWLHDDATWTMVDLELVRRGFAQVDTFPPDVRYVDLFVAAEQTARDEGVGLWAAAAEPTPPPDDLVDPGSNCHPSYTPCLPITDDLDCSDLDRMGIPKVKVIGPDDYRLDRDHDGYGCE